MEKLQNLVVLNPVLSFIVITLLVSLMSFALMFVVPRAQSPESFPGLPIWLIAIWSPNIAAIIIWSAKKNLFSNLQLAFSVPKFSWWMLIILIPILIAAILLWQENLKGNETQWSNFKTSYIIPLIFINLLMGPLGEEIGWRAYLYPILQNNYGWLAGALIVGIIWALWHAPLWLIDSPQSKIPFWAFAVNVLCLSILMSMVYNHSQGSIIPIILFHLIFNVSLGVIDIFESHEPGEYVIKSLYFYLPIVLILLGIHEMTSQVNCPLK